MEQVDLKLTSSPWTHLRNSQISATNSESDQRWGEQTFFSYLQRGGHTEKGKRGGEAVRNQLPGETHHSTEKGEEQTPHHVSQT